MCFVRSVCSAACCNALCVQRAEEATKKIKNKETADNDLTSGQAAALLANEKAVDKLQQELEELEETMQESLRDSEAGRQASKLSKERQEQKKRAEHLEDSDSEDEFFDRTKKRAKVDNSKAVLTVKTICAKLQTQEKEAADLREQLKVCPTWCGFQHRCILAAVVSGSLYSQLVLARLLLMRLTCHACLTLWILAHDGSSISSLLAGCKTSSGIGCQPASRG